MDHLPLLLAACLDSRDACAVIAEADVIRSDTGRVLLKAAMAYYERDPNAARVDRAMLAALLKANATHEKAVAQPLELLAGLPADVSASNVAEVVHAERQRRARLKLADILMRGEDHTDAMAELAALDKPAILTGASQLTAADLLKATADRVPIYPAKLNGVFGGGLAPGHTLIAFGRPGSGKTLLVCNLGAGFLMSGRKVLHIMNEESAESLTMRYLSLLGSSQGFARLENMVHHKADFRNECIQRAMDFAVEQRNFRNLHIVQGIYNYGAVRSLVNRLAPDMVIVDQVRHFGQGDDPLHVTLERTTQALRAHAHEAGFVGVGVTQAGMTGEGKPVLGLGDIDGAKTGLQGACDAIIGVGKGPDGDQTHQRWLSVCRNKISGIIDHFPVWIDEQHTLIKNTL
jgi:hypothetical protein